jgi:hypothetical protein
LEGQALRALTDAHVARTVSAEATDRAQRLEREVARLTEQFQSERRRNEALEMRLDRLFRVADAYAPLAVRSDFTDPLLIADRRAGAAAVDATPSSAAAMTTHGAARRRSSSSASYPYRTHQQQLSQQQRQRWEEQPAAPLLAASGILPSSSPAKAPPPNIGDVGPHAPYRELLARLGLSIGGDRPSTTQRGRSAADHEARNYTEDAVTDVSKSTTSAVHPAGLRGAGLGVGHESIDRSAQTVGGAFPTESGTTGSRAARAAPTAGAHETLRARGEYPPEGTATATPYSPQPPLQPISASRDLFVYDTNPHDAAGSRVDTTTSNRMPQGQPQQPRDQGNALYGSRGDGDGTLYREDDASTLAEHQRQMQALQELRRLVHAGQSATIAASGEVAGIGGQPAANSGLLRR